MKTIYTEEQAKSVNNRIKNKRSIANDTINERKQRIHMIEEQQRLMNLFVLECT